MPIIQKMFFYVVAFSMLCFILSLVRKRRLRENYSLLWMFIALMLLVIVSFYTWLVVVSEFFQANPSSILMFCGMMALLLLVLQLCLMNSSQAMQIKNLAQKIALMEERFKDKVLRPKKYGK